MSILGGRKHSCEHPHPHSRPHLHPHPHPILILTLALTLTLAVTLRPTPTLNPNPKPNQVGSLTLFGRTFSSATDTLLRRAGLNLLYLAAALTASSAVRSPISPYISLHLLISPYISLHLSISQRAPPCARPTLTLTPTQP